MLKKYPIIIFQIEEDHEINLFVRNENNFTDITVNGTILLNMV